LGVQIFHLRSAFRAFSAFSASVPSVAVWTQRWTAFNRVNHGFDSIRSQCRVLVRCLHRRFVPSCPPAHRKRALSQLHNETLQKHLSNHLAKRASNKPLGGSSASVSTSPVGHNAFTQQLTATRLCFAVFRSGLSTERKPNFVDC
jgi:hypothetical protein